MSGTVSRPPRLRSWRCLQVSWRNVCLDASLCSSSATLLTKAWPMVKNCNKSKTETKVKQSKGVIYIAALGEPMPCSIWAQAIAFTKICNVNQSLNQKFNVITAPNASSVCYTSHYSSVFQTADDIQWNASVLSSTPKPSKVPISHPSRDISMSTRYPAFSPEILLV